jgi:hypothetical protein
LQLSPYPGFVNLLGYDDECQILVFERLFRTALPDSKIKELYHRLKFEKPVPLFDLAHGKEQLDFIFDTLTKEKLMPSVEFYRGFCCNLFVGSSNENLTMFDFNAYQHWDVEMAKQRKTYGEGALIRVPTQSDVSTKKSIGVGDANDESEVAVGTLAEYNAVVLANLWMKIGKYYE